MSMSQMSPDTCLAGRCVISACHSVLWGWGQLELWKLLRCLEME